MKKLNLIAVTMLVAAGLVVSPLVSATSTAMHILMMKRLARCSLMKR